jgi:hypothetical protein
VFNESQGNIAFFELKENIWSSKSCLLTKRHCKTFFSLAVAQPQVKQLVNGVLESVLG